MLLPPGLPFAGLLESPAPTAIAADGGFQIVGLREGEYRAQLSASVPGFYLKSIKYGEEEVLGRTFKVSGGGAGSLQVVLRASTATILGAVTDSQSRPVPASPSSLFRANGRDSICSRDRQLHGDIFDLPPCRRVTTTLLQARRSRELA